ARRFVPAPLEALCSCLGGRTRAVNTPASLYHGWWYGMNGVGCQPASSSWMATTGCQLLKKVTPFHCPHRPCFCGRSMWEVSATVTDLAGGSGPPGCAHPGAVHTPS